MALRITLTDEDNDAQEYYQYSGLELEWMIFTLNQCINRQKPRFPPEDQPEESEPEMHSGEGFLEDLLHFTEKIKQAEIERDSE